MQHIQECRKCVTRNLANLGLLHQGIIKQGSSVVLFLIILSLSVRLVAILQRALLRRRSRDIKSHLNELVLARERLLALTTRTNIIAITSRQRELDRDLILSRQVGVRDLRIRNLKRRSVLDIERKLRLAKLGLSPVPPLQSMFLWLKSRTIPVLKDLAQALKVLLRETVELHNATLAL